MPGTGLAARYVAGSGNVGGDWYDVFLLPEGKLGVVAGDVAGSGLAAAVIMGRMRSTLRAYILQAADPAAALRILDRKIQYFEPAAMATVLYGLVERRDEAIDAGIGRVAAALDQLKARPQRPAAAALTRSGQ